MSTLAATNLKHASSASNNIVLDSSGNATFAGTAVPSSSFLRNRIINGDMRIDQRNAGAAVNAAASGTYTVDRWVHFTTQNGRFNIQQNAGSVTPPAGFTNYLGFTSVGVTTIGASDALTVVQLVEGFNVADYGFGSASAVSITLSFWVRSSLTGTFGGSIRNNGNTRSYPFTFTISAANTWEYKTVVIPGDTSGTWLTNNGIGMQVGFGLGVGSTFSGTAGAWAGSNYNSATGAVSVAATSGATFYLTGVQLEVGTAATPFERRQYGQELALCQRYYIKTDSNSALKRAFNNTGNTTAVCVSSDFPVAMRAVPTMTVYGDVSDGAEITLGGAGLNIVQYSYSAFQSITNGQFLDLHYYIASAEL